MIRIVLAIFLLVVAAGSVLMFMQFFIYMHRIYNQAKETLKMAQTKHERTVVRLYVHEDAIVPEIQIFLEGMEYDGIISTIGALEVAKKMCLEQIITQELTQEETDSTLGLLDS